MRQIVAGATLLLAVLLGIPAPDADAGQSFAYRLKPGQTWVAVQQSETITQVMGNESRHRSHQTIEYRVKKGPKTGWVTLNARIVDTSAGAGGGMDVRKATFSAIMHTSGELRQVTAKAPPLPPPPPDTPPQFKALQAQGYQMMLDGWKAGIFWFPEFPPDRLEPGDDFDLNRKMALGDKQTMAMQTAMKQRYILEDVADGLAYFTVKDRSVTRTQGAMGSGTETRTGGKGDAIFDLKTGMWVEYMTKMKMNTAIGGTLPMLQGASSESYNVNRVRMELK